MKEIIILSILAGGLFTSISVSFIIFLDKKDDFKNKSEKIVFVSSSSISIFLFIFLLSFYSVYLVNKTYENKIYDILSLSINSEVDGNFILGSGHIEEKQYYYFYYKTEYGAVLEKENIEYTYIIETNDIEPSLWHVKYKGLNWKTIIYVPENTITVSYDINL